MLLNTRPIGLVIKQHPRDPANVNAWKNMCDPYILSQGKISDILIWCNHSLNSILEIIGMPMY